MAGGKIGGRTYPKHLGPPRFRGLAEDDASGFVRHADKVIRDVRQGMVGKDKADLTPGFGTRHPQDVVQLGVLDDPRPARYGDHVPDDEKSKQDLGISDQEILASIREGLPPRRSC